MKRLTIVLTALLLLAVMATSVAAAPTGSTGSPYFVVTRVDPNAYVYLRVYNFPQGTQVKVYEDVYGTMAVNGALVGGFGADSNTEFRLEMAKSIHGMARGAIRLVADGINISGYFLNVTGGTTTSTTTTGTTLTTIPTFSISSVVVDSKVTILTANFPANDNFNVLMNTMGTLGIGGTQVTTVSSGSGGALSFTFDIPSNLHGLRQIAIRLESPTSGFFSYNWFNNNTSSGTSTGTGTGTSTSSEIVPVFSITSVSKDNTVTITTTGLTANESYDVYMNTFGTAGIGGTLVTTVSSGSGGVKTFTFTIPTSVRGLSRIAIRLVNPSSGFFGYNWFWNSTYP